MDKSDRSLVPEWLRSAGNVTSGGTSTQQLASSSFAPDGSSIVNQTRNRSTKSKGDLSSPRSSYFDRTASSNSRRGSSNGSAKHAYSSFSRNNRDKDRERDKDRLSSLDLWEHDTSDPIGSFLSVRDKDPLRRTLPLVPRKQGEPLLRKDLKNGGTNYHSNSNGILPGPTIGSGAKKAAFEKDFPCLGNEDRQGLPESSVRVSSPGVGSAVQSLPVGSSSLIGGEGWTSALAEVPNVIGSRSTSSVSTPLPGPIQPSSGVPSGATGLNMAEALAQAPSRARTPPEAPGKTQRLEELAIRQSKQLIPVTPSMPKGSVLNSSDKLKTKGPVRTVDLVHGAPKVGPQQAHAFAHVNQSVSSGIKSDPLKSSHGKLLILKPSWENGVSQVQKEAVSPTNGNNRAATNQPAVAPLVSSTAVRSANSPKDRKTPMVNTTPGLTLEKKPFLSQTQSRNDFFNLLKKQNSIPTATDLQASSTNASTDLSASASVPNDLPFSTSVPTDMLADSSTANGPVSSSIQGVDNPAIESPHATANGTEVVSCDVGKGSEVFSAEEKDASIDLPGYPNEQEYAFLRSLGWEENSGEEEGLTEEEIMSFYEECKKRRPTLKVCTGLLPKLAEMEAAAVRGVSELKSSGSGSNA